MKKCFGKFLFLLYNHHSANLRCQSWMDEQLFFLLNQASIWWLWWTPKIKTKMRMSLTYDNKLTTEKNRPLKWIIISICSFHFLCKYEQLSFCVCYKCNVYTINNHTEFLSCISISCISFKSYKLCFFKMYFHCFLYCQLTLLTADWHTNLYNICVHSIPPVQSCMTKYQSIYCWNFTLIPFVNTYFIGRVLYQQVLIFLCNKGNFLKRRQ